MIRSISLILCIIFIAGCGVYSFKGHGIAGIKSIAVDPFDTQTAEFGIRESLAETIISRLLSDRTLSVTDRNNADAILHGTLISVDDSPLTYQSDETVTEYEIRIIVEFVLLKPDKSDPIWEGRLVGEGSYPYSTGSLEERQEGIDKALDRLAQDLLNRLTSDW